MPLINIKKEKDETKDIQLKKKAKQKEDSTKSKKLPYFSKEKIYERELKIVAVEESEFISCALLKQVQHPR